MLTKIESLVEDSTILTEKIDYKNLPTTIFDFTNNIDIRILALELYYNEKKDETIELINRINGMYQMSGISTLEIFLTQITKTKKLPILLRLEAAKSLIAYTELEDEVEADDTEEEKEQKETDNKLISIRNQKKLKNSSNVLKDICIESSELPTPCRVEALLMLMNFEKYQQEAKTCFNYLINDQKIECEFRYNTILALENKILEFVKEELNGLFFNKDFVSELYESCSGLIKSEFPAFSPNMESLQFFLLLIKRLNFDLSRKLFFKYLPKKVNNFEYFLFNAQLSFLFDDNNMTYYKILSSQYLLQKFTIPESQKFEIEHVLLNFAMDNELDYNRRADAADVLLQLGSPIMKEHGRLIILQLGGIEGPVHTVFENAQNVHTEEIDSSVIEILEFFAMLPTYMINKQPISFEYVKEQVDRMLKDNKEILSGNDSCSFCGTNAEKIYCSEECKKLSEKRTKCENSS